MSNDDESKKDDQGSGGSAQKQDAEPKPPVYLFPEHSVYDLAPIVVPDNMRLAPDVDAFEPPPGTVDVQLEEPEQVPPAEPTQQARAQVQVDDAGLFSDIDLDDPAAEEAEEALKALKEVVPDIDPDDPAAEEAAEALEELRRVEWAAEQARSSQSGSEQTYSQQTFSEQTVPAQTFSEQAFSAPGVPEQAVSQAPDFAQYFSAPEPASSEHGSSEHASALAGFENSGSPQTELQQGGSGEVAFAPSATGETDSAMAEHLDFGRLDTNPEQVGTNGSADQLQAEQISSVGLADGTDLISGVGLADGTDLISGAGLADGTDLISGAGLADGTDLIRSEEATAHSPGEVSEQIDSRPRAESESSILKSKIQARKVRATSEDSKIAEDRLLKDRVDHSRAQSRIEEVRAELAKQQAETANESTPAEPQEEWSEHASAVLEHFGWEQGGWSAPEKPVEPAQITAPEAQPPAQSNSEVGRADGTDLIESSTDATSDAQSNQQPSADADVDYAYNKPLFPENSYYELAPIVVPEDQKLSPQRTPTYDPKRASQKLSPIKINKFKPGSQRQAAEARQAAAKAEGKTETPHDDQSTAATHNDQVEAKIAAEAEEVASWLQAPEPLPQAFVSEQPPESVAWEQSQEQVVSEHSSDHAHEHIESEHSHEQSVSEQSHEHGVSEYPHEHTISEQPHEHTVYEQPHEHTLYEQPRETVVSEQPAQMDSSPEQPEFQTEQERNEWAEKSGWEEINSKQDRWAEQTGWEDVSKEQDWDRAGWSEAEKQAWAEQHGEGSPPASDKREDQSDSEHDTASGAGSDDFSGTSITVSEGAPPAQLSKPGRNKLKTVETLFGADDDDDFPEEAEVVLETPAQDTGTQTLELEPAERAELEKQFATTPGDESQSSFAPEDQESTPSTDKHVTTGDVPATPAPEISDSGWGSSAPENYTSQDSIDEVSHPEVPSQETTNPELANADSSSQEVSAPSYPAPEAPVAEHPDQGVQLQGDAEVSSSDQISSVGGADSTDIQEAAVEPADAPVQEERPQFQEPKAREPFDLNRIGIETADIDQIILEHNIELTLRPGGLDDAEYEEQVMRELLLKEQQQELDPQDLTQPDLQSELGEEQPLEEKAEEEPLYDEEDALQEFRPTDSIYEFAPFVLPAVTERLTGDDDDHILSPAAATPKLPPTVKQIVRTAELPERPAIPTFSNDPLVGTILAHSYEVLDVIGQGGMAIVYRAKQIATGRLVAIKTLKSPNPPDLMRFSQEIKTHSQLEHKNIVGFIDSINARDQIFLVMERVRGISLQEIIRAIGKLDEPDNIVDILLQILDALEYAHSGGLIHRDLKTGNIILIKEVDDDMVVKILDFGIAKVQGDLQRLTHVGQALGSPIYMSPEQCSGKTLSTRSDLYSLGVVAYEMVTGTPPYSKGTLINVMAAHCNENIKPKPLSEMAPDLPKYKILDQILQKSMQTDPDKRWQSAGEFKIAMQFWLRCTQNDSSIEDLAVELLRCPVTEFNIDRLIASAGAGSPAVTPLKEAAQPAFSWAQEQSPQAPTQGNEEQPGQSGEPWMAEQQQQVVPGWGEGTQPQTDTAPGWGVVPDTKNEPESPKQWGGSEKHRQSQTSENWNVKQQQTGPQTVQAELVAPASQPQPQPQSQPQSAGPQQHPQAETGDLWNAQQSMQARLQRPVRDLLASPVEPSNNPNHQTFEVQTSVDMNSLGSQLPKLTVQEKQEIRSINASESLQKALDGVDTGTADDTEPEVVAPVDLRRRQTEASAPAAAAPQWHSTAMIIAVCLILTACLIGYFCVQYPDQVQAKFDAIMKTVGGKQNSETPKTPEKSSDTAPSEGPIKNNSEASGETNGKPEDASSKSPAEPAPFKKGEPEEGVDF